MLFHTDAVQAYGQVNINVDELSIDMLSASGHKLNGPKGVGMLYIRKRAQAAVLCPWRRAGAQAPGGTENVPGIVGFGKAVEIALKTMPERTAKERELRDYLIKNMLEKVPYTRLNGHQPSVCPATRTSAFGLWRESLLMMLDMAGICGSSGSACTSGSLDPSHVLLAIGLPHEIAHGSLRLTLNEQNTKEEMDYVVENVARIIGNLRAMSPLYEDFVKKERKIGGTQMSLYSEKVMDHFEHPRNMGEIQDASGVGTVGNAKCGDIMRIFLDIDESGIIQDVKFKTFGCGAAVATSSMATELVKGKSINEALKITNAAVMEALDGLPPVKVHCSLLAEEAIHAALWDYAEKKGHCHRRAQKAQERYPTARKKSSINTGKAKAEALAFLCPGCYNEKELERGLTYENNWNWHRRKR